MQSSLSDRMSSIFGFAAVAFVLLAVTGALLGYSPVPFWDMWDGTIGFYVKVSDGDWAAWWVQHNEHRIVLARLFFWADLAWFNGAGWFLLVINYLLVGLVCFVFWLAWKEQKSEHKFIGFFILAWLFSWSQNNNLTWGFQSQFILAQLLPLSAFYLLHRSATRGEHDKLYFSAAILSGLLAIGSMANGVLALPLMTLYALLIAMGWKRCAILAGLSGAALWLYFHGYHSPASHGSLGQALHENPMGLVRYVLLYIGGPFYYLFGHGGGGEIIATAAGVFLVASSAVFAWRVIPNARQFTLSLALLTFILYIGGTALGTAGGRLIFGVDQALASRYMTPALMAWAALLILYVPVLERLSSQIRSKLWVPFLLLVLLMLPAQLKALHSQESTLFERKVAALALELGVKDQLQIGNIFPSAEWALTLSEAPVARNLSIFGSAPIRDAREAIDKTSPKIQVSVRRCQGSLDEVQIIEGEHRYLRVRGWFFDPMSRSVPEVVRVIGEQGKMKGIALSGQPRPDVVAAIDPAAGNSGFKGYVLANIQGKPVELIDPRTGCGFSVQLPRIPFGLKKNFSAPDGVSVSIGQVQAGNEWTGSDFDRSNMQGLVILGSFIHSDADTGSINLKMKRGDKLLYRSGPTGGRQVLEVLQAPQLATVMPVSTDWTQVDFSSDLLPETFDLKLTDKGSSWGEWSAIALKSK